MIGCRVRVLLEESVGIGEKRVDCGFSALANRRSYTKVFDAEKGRLIRLERQGTVRGDLVVEVVSMQAPVRFTIETSVRVRVFDKKPPE